MKQIQEVTQDKLEISNFYIREFAKDSLGNRHHFENDSFDLSTLRGKKEQYHSYFLHSNNIDQYYKTNKSIGNYINAVHATELIIDIDDKSLDIALEKTRKLIKNLENNYEVDPRYLKINFSGSKGFHVRIPSVLFGEFEPSTLLPQLHKKIVNEFFGGSKDGDLTIYKTTGLIRVVNSVNSKSELTAIPLSSKEVYELSIDEIKELAKSPKEIEYYDDEELKSSDALVELKKRCLLNLSAEDEISRHDSLLEKLDNSAPIGNRTDTLTRLAGLLNNKGVPLEIAMITAKGWNVQNDEPLDEKKLAYTVEDIYNRYKEQSISERTKHFYSYETSIYQASIVGDEFSLKKIGEKKLYTKLHLSSKEDEKKVFEYVVRNNHIDQLRRIDYMSNVEIDRTYYDYDKYNGIFNVNVRPKKVEEKDNLFIEEYLEKLFGHYKDFIKKWLAVYCYTNYKKLPFLIFTGDRGTSKNTFAEMVASIYPSLSSFPKELEGNFNPDAEKKLLVIDESDSNGKMQYKTLKKISGQRDVVVNKKYIPQYKVRNNMNMMILSNDFKAIYVDREEMPANEFNNQFFVFRFAKAFEVIDPGFGDKLIARIGHYVRTELKEVFERIKFDGCRYSIPVPITEDEKTLFQNSITDIEADADKLVNRLILDCEKVDSEWKGFVEEGYIPTNFFSLYNSKNSDNKIIEDLKRRNYLINEPAGRYKQINSKRPYLYKLGERWLREIKTSKVSAQ